jgi:hypothetical protein
LSLLPMPRATRIDASAMVDGWYSTELIAARIARTNEHLNEQIGSDGMGAGARGGMADL